MIHLTLNSRHSSQVGPDLLTARMRECLQPVLDAGHGNLSGQGAAYRLEIVNGPGGAVFTVFRWTDPLSTSAVATSQTAAESLWPVLDRLWISLADTNPAILDLSTMDAPVMPKETPWLATVLLPALLLGTAKRDVPFLGYVAACAGLLLSERLS